MMSHQLGGLVQDALRFVRYHCPGIETSPPHVYSALLFTPAQSVIRSLYQMNAPQWLSVNTRADDTWSQCIQSIESLESDIWHGNREVIFFPDGRSFATTSSVGIDIWHLATGELLQFIEWLSSDMKCMEQGFFEDNISSMAISCDGSILAVASSRKIVLWDMTIGRHLRTVTSPRAKFTSVLFANDKGTLASGLEEGSIMLWNAKTGECLSTLKDDYHSSDVNSIVFSRDGHRLTSAVGQAALVWDTITGRCLQKMESHRAAVKLVAFHPTSAMAQSISVDNTFKVWDIATGVCLRTMEIEGDLDLPATFSMDLEKLAAHLDPLTIGLWDLTTGHILRRLEVGYGTESLAFSPDEKTLITASKPEGIKIWDMTVVVNDTSGRPHRSPVHSVAFSADGERVVSMSDDVLKIWEFSSGRCLQTIHDWGRVSHHFKASSVTFSGKGVLLALVLKHVDCFVELRDLNEGVFTRRKLLPGTSPVNAVEFSPDNITLAVFRNETMDLWNINTDSWQASFELRGYAGKLRFSATGSHIYDVETHYGEVIEVEGKLGTVLISGGQFDYNHMVGYSFLESDSWVRKDGDMILWLPLKYRPFAYAFAVVGSTMAIGTLSGDVWFLRFP